MRAKKANKLVVGTSEESAAELAVYPDERKIFHAVHPGGKAYGYQTHWADDKAKYKLAVKARQIGISTTEAIKCFIKCLLWQESEASPRPPVIAFASPSNRQSARLMHYIQRARHAFEKKFKAKLTFRKEREDWLYLDNFTEIWSLPNSPRTIEGLDITEGIIDELGNFEGREDREVYDSMMGSLAAKGGGITLFGKPRGRRGLFWELYDPYGTFRENFSVHEFPWEVRANVDPVYKKTVEDQRSRMSASAFQEIYECGFIDESVVCFPWELIDRQTDKEIQLWPLHRQEKSPNPLYMGVDFGRKEAKTAISIVEHGDKRTLLRYHGTLTGEFENQKTEIKSVIRHFKPVKCLVDETGMGIPLADDLEKDFAGIIERVHFSNATKEKLVLTTRNLFEEGRLAIPDIRELKEQLHGIEKEVLESGRIKYTGKRSETDWLDDRAWSLFLACAQLGEGAFQKTTIEPVSKKPMTEHEMWIKDLDEDGNPL